MYYAIIGDIVDSKLIPDRLDVQEKLIQCLSDINQEYYDFISSNFIITLGDEFQGLLHKPNKLFEIISKIQIRMQPTVIRFGIGIGEIVTKINKSMSLGSDGPAWWNARKMINDLKKNEKGLKGVSNIKISGFKNKHVTDLVNMNLSLIHTIEQKWTPDQKAIVDYLFLKFGLTQEFVQKNVARELNISSVNLNKKLKLSLYYDYVHSKEIITYILEEEGK